MEYKSASEKAVIIPNQVARPSADDIFKKHPDIRNIKHKIIVLLSIELVVMTIYLILQIFNLILHDIKIDKGIFIESLITVISIVYLIVFIIAMTKYFPVAILIFAWLTLIQLIGGFVILTLAIMAIVVSLSLIDSVGGEIIIDIMFSIVAMSIIVLSVRILLLLRLLYDGFFPAFDNSLFVKFGAIDQIKSPSIRLKKISDLVIVIDNNTNKCILTVRKV